jgi:hypothetical protein
MDAGEKGAGKNLSSNVLPNEDKQNHGEINAVWKYRKRRPGMKSPASPYNICLLEAMPGLESHIPSSPDVGVRNRVIAEVISEASVSLA